MTDNVIRLVWDRESRDYEKHPEGRAGEIIDLRDDIRTFYVTGQFLEELVVFRRQRYGRLERYGFFEIRMHRTNGEREIDQFYFPEKYQIPNLVPGITYLFPVCLGPHPESGEPVMFLCHNDPITRLI